MSLKNPDPDLTINYLIQNSLEAYQKPKSHLFNAIESHGRYFGLVSQRQRWETDEDVAGSLEHLAADRCRQGRLLPAVSDQGKQ